MSNQPERQAWIVWNADKTEGFVTTDRQLAYEVRKSSDTNCVDADGRRSDVGIAFCDAWGDQDCTMEPLALASAPAADERTGAAEHYDEVKATLQGAHRIMENVSKIERKVGPIGSHARGYTHKITNALHHLDALYGSSHPTTKERKCNSPTA